MNLQIIKLPILFFLFVCSCTLKENKTDVTQEGKLEPEPVGELCTTEKKEAFKQKITYELDFLPVDKSISKNLTLEIFSNHVNSGLPTWIKYYEEKSQEFDIDSFKNTHTTVLQPYQQSLGDKEFQKQFFGLYNPFLIWSPDSAKAIDLYSYSHILDYDSLGMVYGMRNVDCQIALLDFTTQKRIVLSTFGPVMVLQDAFWLNKDTIIVAGIEHDIDEIFIPYYSLIDLTTFLVRYYQQKKELKLVYNTYLEKVFEGIEFE